MSWHGGYGALDLCTKQTGAGSRQNVGPRTDALHCKAQRFFSGMQYEGLGSVARQYVDDCLVARQARLTR
jgi:hypothetical protein